MAANAVAHGAVRGQKRAMPDSRMESGEPPGKRYRVDPEASIEVDLLRREVSADAVIAEAGREYTAAMASWITLAEGRLMSGASCEQEIDQLYNVANNCGFTVTNREVLLKVLNLLLLDEIRASLTEIGKLLRILSTWLEVGLLSGMDARDSMVLWRVMAKSFSSRHRMVLAEAFRLFDSSFKMGVYSSDILVSIIDSIIELARFPKEGISGTMPFYKQATISFGVWAACIGREKAETIVELLLDGRCHNSYGKEKAIFNNALRDSALQCLDVFTKKGLLKNVSESTKFLIATDVNASKIVGTKGKNIKVLQRALRAARGDE